MTHDDFVELAAILKDRPRGSKVLNIMFEFSEDPEHGLYLSPPWIDGEAFTMSGAFQDDLRQIFLEELYENGEIPQHILIAIRPDHNYSTLIVEASVLGCDDKTLHLYEEEDFS